MEKEKIIHFDKLETAEIWQIGGKAKSLGVLFNISSDIPNGFVLTTSFFSNWIEKIIKSKDWEDALAANDNERYKIFDTIKESAKRFDFTDEMKAILEEALEKHSFNQMAIRSSSPEEDLEKTSFAGAYETVLGATKDNLKDAIRKVFASCLDERIFVYKREHGLDYKKPSIAVIVQEQIASEASGVAFSINPVNNCFDEVLINSNFGLGETVVAGTVTPDSFVFDYYKNKLIDKKISKKDFSLFISESGETTKCENKEPEKPSIGLEQVQKIAVLAKKTEETFKKPMDIEWAINGGKLYLLQARPITTCNPLFPEMITKPGERKNLYFDLTVISQGFYEPMSVLGLEIWIRMVEIAKQGTMPAGEDGVLWPIHGRQYVHVSNVIKGMGARYLKSIYSAYDVTFRHAFENIDLKEYIPKKKTKKMRGYPRAVFKSVMRLLRGGGLLGLRHPDISLERYTKDADRIFKYCKENLRDNLPFGQLATNGLAAFQEILSSAGILLSPVIARWKLSRMFRRFGVASTLISLEMDLDGNPTSNMGYKMVELAKQPEFIETKTGQEFEARIKSRDYSSEFLTLYDDYMHKYGCRGMMEIDIASPRTYENLPDFFMRLKLINTDENATNTVKARRQEAFDKLYSIAKKIGKEKAFVRNAEIIKKMGGYREHPKYIYVVVVEMLRKRALELGARFKSEGRIDEVDNIFMLNTSQITEAETNPNLNLRELIDENMRPYKSVEHIKDWPAIVDSRGKIFRNIRETSEGDIIGDAISPGVAKGRAKVLHTPYEKPLEKGDILVIKFSEPSWTPIFINASAVVMEVGGQLQHGAIIAREYGIPCVSGIANATKIIKDGQMIEVDGGSGVVRINKG